MRMRQIRWLSVSSVFLALSAVGITAGAALRVADEHATADLVWGITTAIGLLPIAWEVTTGILRREPGVDLIDLHRRLALEHIPEPAFTGGVDQRQGHAAQERAMGQDPGSLGMRRGRRLRHLRIGLRLSPCRVQH